MAEGYSWYPDQQSALDAGGDLVLSASAGTGKTTILVQKFVRALFGLIEEAGSDRPEEIGGRTLGRMAAITFTELAAAQLKGEIGNQLARRYGERREPNIIKLLRELDCAYIGTIHSFCSRILRDNFLEAGVSPVFGILSEEDAAEIQEEAVTEALEELLAAGDPSPLRELAACLGFGKIKQEILRLAGFLRTDGIGEIEADKLIDQRRKSWRQDTRQALDKLKKILDLMNGFLTEANSGRLAGIRSSKTTLVAEETIAKSLQNFAPIFKQPERLLEKGSAELLEGLPTGKLTTKGFEAFNELLEKLKEIFEKKSSGYNGILWNLAGIEGDVPLMRCLYNATQLYLDKYSKRKRLAECLDFDDLLLFARDLLRDEAVRERYRRQFVHIFVDEFQDVNPLQREIVDLLYQAGEGRSLVVVGDGKQSIYRFRGADILSFADFERKILNEGGSALDLSTNFRSHPALIRTFNKLFTPLFESGRAENPFQMEPGEMEPFRRGDETEQRVEWVRTESPEVKMEAELTALSVLRLLGRPADSTVSGEINLGFGDIAVLLTTTSDLAAYEDALRKYSIPYMVRGGKGFYRQREIWDVASYLKMLWFPEDRFSLTAVLRSPLCLLSDETLFRLAEAEALDGAALFDVGMPFDPLEDEGERFEILRGLVRRHRDNLDRLSSAEIIEELLGATGYEAVLLSRPGGDQSAANLRKLIETARSFESRGVASGLEFTLDVCDRLFKKDEEPQATIIGGEERFVQVLTVHKSKGLQFPAVVIPQLRHGGKREVGPILYDSHSGLGVRRYDQSTGKPSSTASWRYVSESVRVQDEAERLRLLYVAMTRAKEYVILISRGEKKRRGSYVKSWKERLLELLPDDQSAAAAGICILQETDISGTQPRDLSVAGRHPEVLSLQPVFYEDSQTAEAAEKFVRAAFDREPIAVTSLSCGVSDLLGLLLGDVQEDVFDKETEIYEQESGFETVVESPPSSPLDIGSAVHKVLEKLDYRQAPAAAAVTEKLRTLGLGGEAGPAAAAIAGWLGSSEAGQLRDAVRLWREAPFTAVLEQDGHKLFLSGIIDLLAEAADGGLWLLDYKYSRPGHTQRHNLQLRLYALCLGKAFGRRIKRASIVYLGGPEVTDIDIDEADLLRLEETCVRQALLKWGQGRPV
jgi:ATP-dependent helicase/nuclease subunit A